MKIPPLAVGILIGLLMWLVARAIPHLGFEFTGRHWWAVVAAIVGMVFIALGIVSFRRADTTVNPMTPDRSSALVVSGIYRLTRNPMYLGFLFILLGWAVSLSNILSFLFLPVFVLYMNRFQIEPEERALASLFGSAFQSYRSHVRRWL